MRQAQEVIAKVKVKNKMGLHTRPATAIVKLLQASKSEVYFSYKQMRVNAKSILSILMLAAPKHALIGIEAIGEDASETAEQLVAGFENAFGEL